MLEKFELLRLEMAADPKGALCSQNVTSNEVDTVERSSKRKDSTNMPPPPSGSVDGGKNPSQQRGSLPVPQVPIRLTNVWYGRPDGIMDPLPSRG